MNSTPPPETMKVLKPLPRGATVSGVLGYRALAVDFERGFGANRYDYDVVQHGPLIGLTARF